MSNMNDPNDLSGPNWPAAAVFSIRIKIHIAQISRNISSRGFTCGWRGLECATLGSINLSKLNFLTACNCFENKLQISHRFAD